MSMNADLQLSDEEAAPCVPMLLKLKPDGQRLCVCHTESSLGQHILKQYQSTHPGLAGHNKGGGGLLLLIVTLISLQKSKSKKNKNKDKEKDSSANNERDIQNTAIQEQSLTNTVRQDHKHHYKHQRSDPCICASVVYIDISMTSQKLSYLLLLSLCTELYCSLTVLYGRCMYL